MKQTKLVLADSIPDAQAKILEYEKNDWTLASCSPMVAQRFVEYLLMFQKQNPVNIPYKGMETKYSTDATRPVKRVSGLTISSLKEKKLARAVKKATPKKIKK